MKKEQKLGLIREILMSVGAALVAFGVTKESFDIIPAVGAIMALISLVWVFVAKDGSSQIVMSLIRKALSAVGGALVAYGIANPEQNQAIAGFMLPLLSLLFSHFSNGGKANNRRKAVMNCVQTKIGIFIHVIPSVRSCMTVTRILIDPNNEEVINITIPSNQTVCPVVAISANGG